MSNISAIQPGLWRFDGLEQEHKFPVVGYIVQTPDGLILVDPPHAPEAKEEIEQLGRPYAAVVTGPWHVRGVPLWVQEFGLYVAAPQSARDELREAGLYPDMILLDGQEEYGFQVLGLKAGSYDEIAFWHPESGTLLVGDLLTAREDGQVVLGPNVYANVPLADLQPIVERLAALQPKLILSSHLGPREDAQAILDGLTANL